MRVVVGKRLGEYQPGKAKLGEGVRRRSHASEGVGRITRGLGQLDVLLRQRHDLLLLGDAQPAGTRLVATPPLGQRHTPALHRCAQHVRAELHDPGHRLVVGWSKLPLETGGRQGLGRKIVGERRVPDSAEKDRNEMSEPATDEHLVVVFVPLIRQLTHREQGRKPIGRTAVYLEGHRKVAFVVCCAVSQQEGLSIGSRRL